MVVEILFRCIYSKLYVILGIFMFFIPFCKYSVCSTPPKGFSFVCLAEMVQVPNHISFPNFLIYVDLAFVPSL